MLYMVQALLFDKETASQVYGSYTGLVYLTPLIGGYIADRYWGNRRSIVTGALTMALGQFLLFLSACYYQQAELAKYLMFCGLGLLILGNGFFKPNISTMVGRLYREDDNRKDSAFTIFYMGVNVALPRPPGMRTAGKHRTSGRLQMGISRSVYRYAAGSNCIPAVQKQIHL